MDKVGQPTPIPTPKGPGRGQAAAGEPCPWHPGVGSQLFSSLNKQPGEVPLQTKIPRVWTAPGSHSSSSVGFVSPLGVWGMRSLKGTRVSRYRNPEWAGLERTLKIILLHSRTWAGTPSKPHPTQHFQGGDMVPFCSAPKQLRPHPRMLSLNQCIQLPLG